MGFSIQSIKGPDRTQRQREGKFVFLSGSIPRSNLGASCSWVSSLGNLFHWPSGWDWTAPSSFLFLLTSSWHGPVARTRSFQIGMACCFSVSQEGSPRNLSQRSLQDLFFHEQSTHATRIKEVWKREPPGTSPMKLWGCSPLECVRGTVQNVRHYILDTKEQSWLAEPRLTETPRPSPGFQSRSGNL